MRRLLGRTTVSAIIASMAGAAWGQTHTWTGAVNTDWFTAGNWNPPSVPLVGAEVLIPSGFSPVQFMGGAGQTVDLLSLTAMSPVHIRRPLAVADGAMRSPLIAMASPADGLATTGLVTLSGMDTVWSGGVLLGPGEFRNTGTMSIGGDGNRRLRGGVLRNSGTLRLSSAGVEVVQSAELRNEGMVEINGPIGVVDTSNGSGGLLINEGTIRKYGGNNEAQFTANLENRGVIRVELGTIRLRGRNMDLREGEIRAVNPCTVWIGQVSGAPRPRLGGLFSGTGDIAIQPGSYIVEAPLTADMDAVGAGLIIDGHLELAADLMNRGKAAWRSGRIVSDASTPRLRNAMDGALTVPTNATTPILEGAMENLGTFSVQGILRLEHAQILNRPGGVLALTTGTIAAGPGTARIENQGTIRKEFAASSVATIGVPVDLNGGTIAVIGQQLVLSGGGVWSGGSVVLGPSGGRLELSGPEVLIAGGELTLTDVSFSTFRIAPGGTLRVASGQVLCDLDSIESKAEVLGRLTVEPGALVLNTGNMTWNGAIVTAAPGSLINQGATQIEGTCALVGTFDNEGTMQFSNGSVQLGGSAGPGTIRNSGLLRFINGSIATGSPASAMINDGELRQDGTGGTVMPPLDNAGLVRVLSGVLNLTSSPVQLQSGVLQGGTWIVAPGARLIMPATVERIGPDAIVEAGVPGADWLAALAENRGRWTVNASSALTAPFKNAGDGLVEIDPGVALTAPAVQNGDPGDAAELALLGDAVAPSTLITPVLNNHGVLVPGGHEAPGPFNLTGDLVLHPTSRLRIELGGAAPAAHDTIAATGSAALAGTLVVTPIAGFVPEVGQTFAVLSAAQGVSGAFQTVQAVGFPAGLSAEALFSGNGVSVRIVASCYANCDQSTAPPVLNVNDFVCFQQRFAAGDSYANCDGSTSPPILNVNDFVCFQAAFVGGCP